MPHRLDEIGRQGPCVSTRRRNVTWASRQETTLRRAILVAVREHDAGGAAILDEDARHGRVDFDFGAALPRGRGDRVRQRAHAAAHVAPHAAHAVALAHHVMEQHVGRPRHRRRGKRADDRVGRDRRLDYLGLEPAVEDGIGRAGQDFDRASGRRGRACGNSTPAARAASDCRGASDHGIGRRLDQHRFHEARDAFEHGLELRQVVRVALSRTSPPRDAVISLSGPISSERPSGRGVKLEGLRGSIAKPWRLSSRSRMISGRNRLLT